MTGRVLTRADLRRWDAAVFVVAPRERVYDYLADPHNRPQWQASLRRVDVLDEGPPRVGTRWVDHVYGAPPFHLEITRMDRGELWAEVGTSGPFTAYGSLLLEDAERDGVEGTVVRCIARVTGRGAARVLAPFAMLVAALLVRNDLARAGRILSGLEAVTWRESLGPLGERRFRWYFASRCSDTLGTMMAGIALAFAVLEITDSATALGQVLAAHTVPMVVLMLFGGVIADRFPRQLVLQVSNTAAAATQGLLAALVITDRAELWMVMVLAGLNGAVDAINFPAQASMVPQLVSGPQLQSANALISMSRGAIAIVAPTVSALLVVGVGPGWALAANAATWLLAALLILPVHLPARPPQEERTTMLQELAEGWSLFRGTTWLWVVVLGFGFLNAIHVGAWFTLGPVVAKDTIGEEGWGFVLSAESAGLLLMTLLLLRVRLRRPLLVGMLGCSLMGIPLAALGLAPDLALLVVTAFVAGAGIEVFSIGWNLAMQENVEERMLSRAYSYDALGSYVAMPVGQLVYGPLGDAFGNRDVLVWSGVAYVLISLLVLASRSVRTLDRPPGQFADRTLDRPAAAG